MNSLTKRGVIVVLAVLACLSAYLVTKNRASDKPQNNQPIILKAPDLQEEDTSEEHIVGAWGEVVIKRAHTDSVH